MARRRQRTLRPEEIELWNRLVEKASPLHPSRPAKSAAAAVNQSKTLAPPQYPPVPNFRLGEAARPSQPFHDFAPSISEQLAGKPLAIDRRRFAKLKKGRLNPEARIDLHGLTIAQAHPALTRFILESVSDGLRLVLVITGKGKSRPDNDPIPQRHGVLRHQVPHWLHTPPLRAHVLQVTEAHLRHGGQGAYYVYLRRPR